MNFIFPYIGNVIIPTDSYFSEGLLTTNQLVLTRVLTRPAWPGFQDVAAALGADPQMTLTLCAVKRASEIAMGSKEEALQLVGFPPNAGIQDPEGVRNKLAELFSTYLAEIWEIVQVSSVS